MKASVLLMLVSTLCLSLSGLFSKLLSSEVNMDLLIFLRLFLTFLFLFTLLLLKKFETPTKKAMKPIALRALFITLCQVCFFYSLTHLTLVETVVLFSTGPLFIPLLEKLIFSVKLPPSTVLSLLIMFMGVLLLTGNVAGIQIRLELLIGLVAGALNASSQLCLYRMSQHKMSMVAANAWTYLFAAIFILPILLFTFLNNHNSVDVWVTGSSAMWLVGLLVIGMALVNAGSQLARSKAYQYASSNSQVAPLIFTNLLFSTLWQLLFFDESYSFYQQLGLGLIVFASILNMLFSQLKKAPFK